MTKPFPNLIEHRSWNFTIQGNGRIVPFCHLPSLACSYSKRRTVRGSKVVAPYFLLPEMAPYMKRVTR